MTTTISLYMHITRKESLVLSLLYGSHIPTPERIVFLELRSRPLYHLFLTLYANLYSHVLMILAICTRSGEIHADKTLPSFMFGRGIRPMSVNI